MSSGSYFPQPTRMVETAKKSGGVRPLGIPVVSDRIAEAVVTREVVIKLEPVSLTTAPTDIGPIGAR